MSSPPGNPVADTASTKNFSVAWYVVRFVIILGVLEAVFLLYLSEHGVFEQYLNGYASLSGKVLRLFGGDVQTHGQVLSGGGASIEVRRGCDAFQPIALFCANVLAFPAPRGRKALGVVVGVVVLLVANLGRIVSLFWLSQAGSEWFEQAHVTIWPVAFIILSLALWLAWARWAGTK